MTGRRRDWTDQELASWEVGRRAQIAYRRAHDPRLRTGIPEAQADHGSMARYRSGCKCGPCRREANDYRVIMANRAKEPRRIGL